MTAELIEREVDPYGDDPNIYQTDDGWLVDLSTGELIGIPDPTPEFHITDMASAEWVLERMQLAEAEVAKQKRIKEARILAADAMINTAQKRVDWLLRRWGAELEQYAKEALKGRKEKHIKTGFGRLEFSNREKQKIVVDDLDKALRWCARHAKSAIKVVKSIYVSELKGRTDLPKAYFSIVEPKEKFDIDTGV